MRPVVLSGFMATGKSTVGPRLAARLGVALRRHRRRDRARDRPERPRSLARRGRGRVSRARGRRSSRSCSADGTPAGRSRSAAAPSPRRATRRFALDRAICRHAHGVAREHRRRASPTWRSARTSPWAAIPLARARELLAQRAERYAECHLTLSTDALDPDRGGRRRRRARSSAIRWSCPSGRAATRSTCASTTPPG